MESRWEKQFIKQLGPCSLQVFIVYAGKIRDDTQTVNCQEALSNAN